MESLSFSLVLSLLLMLAAAEDAKVSKNGGWLPVTEADLKIYYSDKCNIPKIPVSDITKERFTAELQDKAFIITFPNGVEDWCISEKWSAESLKTEYDGFQLGAGKPIDIVYDGGKTNMNRTFREFIHEMRSDSDSTGDLTYLFDRSFYFNSSLPETITVPEFLAAKGDPIFFIGQSGTGATFHKHMPAWNGVVYGQKRWFLYPVGTTPPGGLYAYTTLDWYKYVYPNLTGNKLPMECVQNAGEIFYVPESYYHAILNIGETVAISIQQRNTSTALETEFYDAMEYHYKATTKTDEEEIKKYEFKAEKTFVDLHFALPENTEVLTHLSEMACHKGDAKRCERILKLLLKIDPFAVESLKLLSRIYYDQGKHEQAEETLLLAVKIHPNSKTVIREHANLLWNNRRPDSKAVFEKLLSIMDPLTTEAEEIRNILTNNDFSEVREAVEKTVSEDDAANKSEHNEWVESERGVGEGEISEEGLREHDAIGDSHAEDRDEL